MNGVPAIVVWRPVHDRLDAPTGMIGFVDRRPTSSPGCSKILPGTPHCCRRRWSPPPASPNAALAVRVATPDGRQLFASAADWSAYEAGEQLARELGGSSSRSRSGPTPTEGLVIGGLPKERLPLVIGLLTLTAGLVGSGARATAARNRAGAHALRFRLGRVARAADAARPDPHVHGNAAARAGTLTRRERRSLEIIARETQRLIAAGRERAAVLPRRAPRATPLRRERPDWRRSSPTWSRTLRRSPPPAQASSRPRSTTRPGPASMPARCGGFC